MYHCLPLILYRPVFSFRFHIPGSLCVCVVDIPVVSFGPPVRLRISRPLGLPNLQLGIFASPSRVESAATAGSPPADSVLRLYSRHQSFGAVSSAVGTFLGPAPRLHRIVGAPVVHSAPRAAIRLKRLSLRDADHLRALFFLVHRIFRCIM